MNVYKLLKYFTFTIVLMQLGLFIFVKQGFNTLERKNERLEQEINRKIDENNLLKIKLTTMQNEYRIKKLLEKLAIGYKPFKPKQVIEKNSI